MNESPNMIPDQALTRLKAGNDRFASGKPARAHTDEDRRARTLRDGQQPFATVLSCCDSRVPVEIVFDHGIGDIFVVRVVGNVSMPDVIGCIEYGVEHLGTPLVVVMGHTDCGGIKAAVRGTKLCGSLAKIMYSTNLAVDRIGRDEGEITDEELIREATVTNVWLSIEDLFRGSHATREGVSRGALDVIGAVYHLDTGRVEWLGKHPEQDRRFVH